MLDTHTWATTLKVPEEAIELYRSSEVIDLHIDTFIWKRIFGYDLQKKHQPGPFDRHFMGHTDFPRAIESGLTGACWVITTFPFRTASGRKKAFYKNLNSLKAEFAKAHPTMMHVRNVKEYRKARALGKHGAWVSIQGGNALDPSMNTMNILASGDVLRVTLVHLTPSSLGASSTPFPFQHDQLTLSGHDYIRQLDEMNILIDLAHIGRNTFFDVANCHNKTKPLVVTHTGIDAVHPHWRNLTDAQIKIIAESGGFIGIMFQESFLGNKPVDTSTVVDHIEYIINLVGDDIPAIGSDYDGMITPPRDLPSPFFFPRLVAEMLHRNWSDTRIKKILGENVLRVISELRG